MVVRPRVSRAHGRHPHDDGIEPLLFRSSLTSNPHSFTLDLIAR